MEGKTYVAETFVALFSFVAQFSEPPFIAGEDYYNSVN